MSLLLLFQGSGSTAPAVAGNLGTTRRLLLMGVGVLRLVLGMVRG